MVKSDNIDEIIDHKLFSEDDIHEMCGPMRQKIK